MINHKHIGFICKKVNYKDNDAICSVITSNFKIVFKARGILKITSKNAASCNYFMLCEYNTNSKTETSNQTLKSANVIKIYKKPLNDLLASASYLFMCNVLDQLSDSINGYDFTLKCFDYIEDDIYPIDVLNYFLKNLCISLGYQSNIKGCINCNKQTNLISFDIESGGFICNQCFDSLRHEKMPTSILKSIHLFLKNDDLIQLSQQHSIKIFMMYIKFLKDCESLKLESADFVMKCL